MKFFLPSPARHVVSALLLVIFDIVIVTGAYWLALYISYGCEVGDIPVPALRSYFRSITIYLIVSVMVYRFAKMYDSIWRLVSYYELCVFGLAPA